MSYDEQSGRPVSPDRTIQLISEARDHDDFLYRTLFGNKSLPHVVYQLEHFTILFDVETIFTTHGSSKKIVWIPSNTISFLN